MMGHGYWHAHWGKAWDSSWWWSTKFAWLPAQMDSGRWVWFKEYYHGSKVIQGPGTPVVLKQYMTSREYLFYTLKQS